MGTRSVSIVKVDGIFHSQYSQFDGYLACKGFDFLEWVSKAYSYLAYVEKEQGRQAYLVQAAAVGRAHLWEESLLTGHGWRVPDKDGRDWAYQEQTELDLEQVAGNTEYVRLADFDQGILGFYKGSDLSCLMFALSMKDISGEFVFYGIKEPLKEIFKAIDESGLDTVDLKLSEKKANGREYRAVTVDGKICAVSHMAPEAQETEAEANLKNLKRRMKKLGAAS
jgi:hypothetical protein